MCNGEVLHTSYFGYVARCPQCQGLHLSFGTCWLTLTWEEFEYFLTGANQQLKENPEPEDPAEKTFFCETSSRQVKISLNYHELSALSKLMNQAACVIRARDLLAND